MQAEYMVNTNFYVFLYQRYKCIKDYVGEIQFLSLSERFLAEGLKIIFLRRKNPIKRTQVFLIF